MNTGPKGFLPIDGCRVGSSVIFGDITMRALRHWLLAGSALGIGILLTHGCNNAKAPSPSERLAALAAKHGALLDWYPKDSFYAIEYQRAVESLGGKPVAFHANLDDICRTKNGTRAVLTLVQDHFLPETTIVLDITDTQTQTILQRHQHFPKYLVVARIDSASVLCAWGDEASEGDDPADMTLTHPPETRLLLKGNVIDFEDVTAMH